MKLEEKAIKLFLSKTNFTKNQIKKYRLLKNGFSNNANYLFELKNKEKFQVKLPLNKNVYFPDVKAALLYKPDIYIHIDNDGTMIKKWIEGKHEDLSNPKHAEWVLEEVAQLHNKQVKYDKFGLYDVYAYRETTQLDKALIEEFDILAKELEKYPIVFTHGDLNIKNILITKKQAFLIDFEWAKMGYAIIDYVSLIAFSNIDIEIVIKFTKYDIKELQRFVRFVLIHTLMWCEKENTDKSLILEEQIIKKLNG